MRASAGAFRHVCGFDDVPWPSGPPLRPEDGGRRRSAPGFAPPQPLLETARLETGRDGTEYTLKSAPKIGGSADIPMRECKAGVGAGAGGVASSRIR
jgi:hypothetical protein